MTPLGDGRSPRPDGPAPATRGSAAVLWLAQAMVMTAVRRLPASRRQDRRREWTAELPAILEDPDGGPVVLRAARTLRFAAGQRRACRRLARAAGTARHPALTAALCLLGLVAGLGYVVGGTMAALAVAGPEGAVPALAVLIIAALAADMLVLAAIRRMRKGRLDSLSRHM